MAITNARITVGLSTDLQTLENGSAAKLTFTFSEIPHGFTLNDIFVKNGVVTNLVQDLHNPYIFRCDFIGGVAERSGMSSIQLNGNYYNANGSLGTPSNTVTIKNMEPVEITTVVPTVGFTCNNSSAMEGNADHTQMNFTVNLSSASDKYVTVAYSTNQKLYGTAFTNEDYIAKDDILVFAPGETSKTICIDVVGDKNYEATESFYVDLISANGACIVINGAEGLRSNWAVGNIINDDIAPMPTIGLVSNNTSIVEGNADHTHMNFTVKLSCASTEDVTVDYTTGLRTYGTAKAGEDYVPDTGSITFAAGETSKVISIDVIGDKKYEGNETFYLDLVGAHGGTIVTNGAESLRSSWAVGTIVNDDVSDKTTVAFTRNNASTAEGNSGNHDLNFTVQLSSASTETVTVDYTTGLKTYGSAKAGIDYVSETGTVTFAPGETSKTVGISVIGDSSYESSESFYVDLVRANGATVVTNGAEGLRSSWAVGNITNDDVVSVVTKTDLGIFGTTSKDIIGGTSADDYIYGRGGSDVITGFSGKDTFVFSKIDATVVQSDAAQITDFKDGTDKLCLRDLFYDDVDIFQGVGANANNTYVSLHSGETLAILVGVNRNTIDSDDFSYM